VASAFMAMMPAHAAACMPKERYTSFVCLVAL